MITTQLWVSQALGKLNLPISDFANFKLEVSQKKLVLAGWGNF